LTAGSYFLIVRADITGAPPGEISEANEGNNTRAIALRVVRPDLLVQSVTVTSSVAATPSAVAPGLPITVRTTIKNQAVAGGTAAPTVLRLYLSSDATLDGGDTQLGDDIPVPAIAGGGVVTVSRIVPIPDTTLLGPYYVIAQVNATNTTLEADSPAQGNDVKATLTPLIVGPDLMVSAATASPAATAPGFTVAVTNTVRNTGGQPTGPFDVGIYLSSDGVYDGGDQLLGTRRVPMDLAAGAASTAVTSVTLPNTLTAGSYFLIVRADITGAPPGEISEANEGNNTRAIALRVVRPDLLVQSVTVTSSVAATPSAVAPGLPITVRTTIKNQAVAGGTAAPTVLRLYLSSDATLDGGDTQLGDDIPVPAIAGGGVVTVSRIVPIPDTTLLGPYYVIAQVNATNTTLEADSPAQGNDVKATLTPLIVGPDLMVSTATASPAATAPGFTVAVTNTVRNAGGQPTGPFDVGIYLSSDGVYDGGDQLLGTRRVTMDLAAGAASTAVTSVTLPNTLTAGSYFLIVRADITGAPPGEISEANEGNNTRAIALRVVRPDLLVQSVTVTSSVAATPSAVAPGLPITVRTTIKNQAVAGGTAAPTVLRLYLSSDATLDGGDTQLGDDIPVPAIAGGGVVTVSRIVPIPDTTLLGPYYVIAQVNATNTTLEADSPAQGNDVKATLTPLIVGPDLMVSTATASPAATAPGFTVAVTNTVRNAGGQPTGPFDVGIYLSSDGVYDGGDQLLGTRRVTMDLAAGAASTAVTSVTLPNTLTAGSYFLIVRADITGAPPGEISEANEGNNTRAIALRVVRPDLLVQSVTVTSSVAATPSAVAPGLPITVRTTIKNQAVAGGTAAPTVLRLYLSSDATLDGGDTQLGDEIPVPAIAGGGVVTVSRIVPIPDTTLLGPYYVLAQVNATNTVFEADSPAQ